MRRELGRATLFCLAFLQVFVVRADAARVVGVAGSDVVSLDVQSGESTTLFAGDEDLGADSIVWSPDETFAYILAYRDVGVRIFDGEAIVGEIPIARPDHVSFHPSRPLALVQGDSSSSGAPLFMVDTRTHAIVEELSVRRSWDPWVFTEDGRWAVGWNGDVVDLDERAVRDAAFCGGADAWDYFPTLPWQGDEVLMGCSRYLARYRASTGAEVDRVYFRDTVVGVGALPAAGLAMVVTPSAIYRVTIDDLEIVETIAYPDRIPDYDRESYVYFSEDGTIVELGYESHFRTADLSFIAETSRWWWRDGAPVVAELVGRVRPLGAWRARDRSYYYVGAAVSRFNVDTRSSTIVTPHRRLRNLLTSPLQDSLYVVLEETLETNGLSVDGGGEGSPTGWFDQVEDRSSLVSSVAPRGDAIHYRHRLGPDEYFIESIDFLTGDSLGSIVVDTDEVYDFEYSSGLGVAPLSRTRALILGSSAQFGFVDLATGELLASGGRDAYHEDRILSASVDPAGDGAYLLLRTELDGTDTEVAVVRHVEVGSEAAEVWRGPQHFQPRLFAVHPSGGEIYVSLSATHNGRHRIAVVDPVAGETRAMIQVSSFILDMSLSEDGKHLLVAMQEQPHLLVVDTAERKVVGAVRDAPILGSLSVRGSIADVAGLLEDAVLPELPPQPDVAVFEDWWRIGPDLAAFNSVVLADSTGTIRVPLSDDGHRVRSLSTSAGKAHVVEWLSPSGPGEYIDGLWTTIDLETGAFSQSALDDSLLWTIAAPQGDVAFSVRDTPVEGEILVSVVDLAGNEVVHSLRAPGRAPYRHLSVSPDGTYVAVSREPVVVMDTRDSSLFTYDFSAASIPALLDGHAYYTPSDDGRWLLRVAIDQDAEPERLAQLASDKRAYSVLAASPSGDFIAVNTNEYNRAKSTVIVSLDGTVSEVRRDDPNRYVEGFGVSQDGRRLYVSTHRAIDVLDIEKAERVARIPSELQPNLLAVGCGGACPTPPPTPLRTPWNVRGTVPPLPTATPRPSGTPGYDTVDGYDWFEIDPIAARPGDQVEIRLRHRSTSDRKRPIALRNDLILPPGLELAYWPDGTLDCEGWYRPWNRYHDSDEAEFEVTLDACGDDQCSRVTAIAASEWERKPNEVLYRCRAWIRDDVAPGEYRIASENLVVFSWDPDYEPFVVPGRVVVVEASAARPAPPSGGAPPEPQARMEEVSVLSGSAPGGVPGEEVGVGFRLNPTSVLPGGELIVEVEIPDGLSIVQSESGYPRCGINFTNTYDYRFAVEEATCGAAPCRLLTLTMPIETEGTDYYHSEEARRWLRWFDLPVFECRYVIDPDTRKTRIPLSLRLAMLNGRALETEPGVVHVHQPEPTLPPPTPSSSATQTPTPRAPSRPCEPIEAGRAILCVGDIEADPGEPVEIVVHYRSGGAMQAGLQFDLHDNVVSIDQTASNEIVRVTRADCEINEAADKDSSAFAVNRDGTLRALILSFSHVRPLPDELALVTCNGRVRSGLVPGHYEIVLDELAGSDPKGNPLPLDVRPGRLRVRGTIPPTPTHTAVPTATHRSDGRSFEEASSSDGGGCQVTPAAGRGVPAQCVLVLVALLVGLARGRSFRRLRGLGM